MVAEQRTNFLSEGVARSRISVVLGFAFGTELALMRLSSNPVLVGVSWFYTWFFRGVPMLLRPFISGVVDGIARDALEHTLKSVRGVLTK